MKIEVPECARCCCCVPLRFGILIYGYLNLIFSIFVICVQTWIDYRYSLESHTMAMYRGVEMYTELWLPYVLYAFEIIFNVVLIIGAHLKRTKLIRAYYYYGIITTVAAFISFVVVRYENQFRNWYLDTFELCLAFCGLVLQLYLLFLVRSELQKLKFQEGQLTYVNHMVEVVAEPFNYGEGRNPL